MLILTIRTDKPESEIGLFENDKKLAYEKWQAHRQLSMTIHKKIETILKSQQKSWNDIQAVVCFKGPGSFTGLRIGITVGNSLAENLQIPIISTQGEDWIAKGLKQLKVGKNEKIVLPEYGGTAHITTPRK